MCAPESSFSSSSCAGMSVMALLILLRMFRMCRCQFLSTIRRETSHSSSFPAWISIGISASFMAATVL
uniref:Putative secreted peptide n=1 Tax=Anopheles braziliensis TaxID=58242 RepID=A0A2M3ZRI7_9DIPT